jgi:hypothetical protein
MKDSSYNAGYNFLEYLISTFLKVIGPLKSKELSL